MQLLLKKSEAKEDPYSSTKGWNQQRRRKRRSHDPNNAVGYEFGKPSERLELSAHEEGEEEETDREELEEEAGAGEATSEPEIVEEDSMVDGPRYISPSKLLAQADDEHEAGYDHQDDESMKDRDGDTHLTEDNDAEDGEVMSASFMTVNLEETFEEEA